MKFLRLLPSVLMLAATMPLAPSSLRGASIDLSIVNPNRFGSPGDIVTFTGVITNNTEDPLDSTDLFLNFSAFDPVRVTLDQLLGLTSFVIPNGSSSPPVNLFTFTLSNTAGPATYPAQVVLETALGDTSEPQTVTVTVVPEPGSFAFVAFAGLTALLVCTRKRSPPLVPIVLVAVAACQVSMAQVTAVRFVTAPPGLGVTGSTVMLAQPITNNGTLNAVNVQVTAATLRTATLTAPAAFPVLLGTIAPANSAVFEASFDASALVSNTPYLLTVRGTYQVGGVTAGFAVNRFITIPPGSPGSGNLNTNFVSPISPRAPFSASAASVR